MGWPVIDPLARYRLAQEKGNAELQARHNRYFGDEAGMEAASPPHMIERGERVDTPPALLLQGSADESLPAGMAERFVQLYSGRGGIIECAKYPGAPHGFMRNDDENTRAAFRLDEVVHRQAPLQGLRRVRGDLYAPVTPSRAAVSSC